MPFLTILLACLFYWLGAFSLKKTACFVKLLILIAAIRNLYCYLSQKNGMKGSAQ